jgi:hypothetical protein
VPIVFDNIELPGIVYDVLARVDVYLIASATDSTVPGVIAGSDISILDKVTDYTNGAGYVEFDLRANSLISPANSYYVWETHFRDGRVSRRLISVPNGAGPYHVADIETSTPGPVPCDLQGTLAARPSAVGYCGSIYWADDVLRAYRSDGADWWPLDTGNGLINGADYGLTGAIGSDVTSNLQSLATDARADNLGMFIPPVPVGGYHKVSGTVDIDLGAAGGMVIRGFGGTDRALGIGGSTEIANTVNNLPIFAVDSDTFSTGNFNIDGLSLYGFGLYFRAANAGGGSLAIDNTGFYAAGAPQCMTLIDSFWHRFRRVAFTSKDTSSPSVLMQGSDPTGNENIVYLFHWQEILFANAGVRYEQNVNYLPNQAPGQWIMSNVDTEGFAKGGPGLIDLVRGAGVTDAVTLQGIRATGIRHFDPVAGSGSVVPFGRSNAGTKFQDVTLDTCLFLAAAIVNNSGNTPVGLRLLNPAGDYIPCVDAAGARLVSLSSKEKNGNREYFGSSLSSLYGSSVRQDTDTASRWGVRESGKHEWSDGVSAADVNLYRGAAGILKTDNQIQANKVSVGTNGFIGTEKQRLNGTGSSTGWDIEDGTGSVKTRGGSGSPESVVTAGPGSLYMDYTNGEVYVKKTGAGNTGWKIITHA